MLILEDAPPSKTSLHVRRRRPGRHATRSPGRPRALGPTSYGDCAAGMSELWRGMVRAPERRRVRHIRPFVAGAAAAAD